MFTRSDNYLSLCLEQASKSPLHYRHGCIIVRGGKIIGSGFNDNRSGFSGNALKTGKLANNSLDGPALQDLKSKLKRKLKSKHKSSPESSSTFTPYESNAAGTGGGPYANTPLTMHSEMMAIQNALAASSASASSAMSYQKPCWKLPSDSKRKVRLRREVLEAYVERVCSEAATLQTGQKQQQSGKQRSEVPRVQASQFEPRSSQPGAAREREEWNEREEEEQQQLQQMQQHGGAASVAEYCVRPYGSTCRSTTTRGGASGRGGSGSPPASSPFWSLHPSWVSVRVCI